MMQLEGCSVPSGAVGCLSVIYDCTVCLGFFSSFLVLFGVFFTDLGILFFRENLQFCLHQIGQVMFLGIWNCFCVFDICLILFSRLQC